MSRRSCSIGLAAAFCAVAVLSGCGGKGSTDVGADAGDAGTPDADPWGGRTIDDPYVIDQIELVDTISATGFTAEFYRNGAYTCGRSGYQTFAIVYPDGLPLTQVRPLWVRMHGGGVGAFAADQTYVPPEQINRLDEEGAGLALQIQETGLMTEVRTHVAGFRFMMPSMCDHDVYSGVGLPEPYNPHSPDENGDTRAADGLLATKAAIAYTRDRVATSHVFLQGTSAGSIGAFSVAYSFEREGLRLSGIVMDSHLFSEAFVELIEQGGCTGYDPELTRNKIGPMTDTEHLPDRVVLRGGITVPIMHVWSRGDPSCCGETPFVYVDEHGQQQTMGSCDYHHEALRAAIEQASPAQVSENLRMCVNDPATSTPGVCNMHSPTKIAYDESTPAGDQDQGGRDYNAYIMDWVTDRLSDPPP